MTRLILLLIMIGMTSAMGQVKYEYLKHHSTGAKVPLAGTFSTDHVVIPKAYRASTVEMRGVWVATVGNIDFPAHATVEDFKRDFINLVENLRQANFNTLIFQVRPTNDAFYSSTLNPWSRYLTGQEGQSLRGFDPLQFMIAETHRRKIEFHAWLNPYRVINSTTMSKTAYLKTLAPRNFARIAPQMVLDVPSGKERLLILNPGEPRVVKFITDTVREIIEKYDVDAIHFDDYFYPYKDIGQADAATFAKNNPQRLALDVWRRNNVDTAIKSVSDAIKAYNRKSGKNIEFGISPFGIWANQATHPAGSLTKGLQSHYTQYADTRKWCHSNWIDYIVPQVYWSFDFAPAAYGAVTDWWAYTVRDSKVKLYIGHAAYKLGDGGAWQNYLELCNQLRYNGKHPEIRGSCFFSYKSIFTPANKTMLQGMEKITREYWKYPAQTPR